MKRLLPLIASLLLSACGGEPYVLGPQVWDNVQIQVETRPSPPTAGMTEFLVIATNSNRTQAHDLVVSLRMSPTAEWKQAIQDGHVGVYRTALRVADLRHDVLQVQLRRRSGALGELLFPLAQGH